ncbi:MAG: pseudouridine synthase [Burkholderiaceae bacterium]
MNDAPERPRRTRGPPGPPRVAATLPEAAGAMRLSKRMAELGLCSRREADEWISRGWVFVDGVRTDVLGSKVTVDQKITVTRAAAQEQDLRDTVLINKPIGLVSGQAEDGYKPASTLVVPNFHWSGDPRTLANDWRPPRGLAPAGRLDIDSTGLLVLTQDGRIARQLINDDSEIEKEYLVRVAGSLSEDEMKLLRHGMSLDGVALKAATVEWENRDQLRFVLREGKKRQIRRMCEMVRLHVLGLRRVRVGRVMLGDLPVGQWRYLAREEAF